MMPEEPQQALVEATGKRPCRPVFPTSNHLSCTGGLVKPQEEVESVFSDSFHYIQLFSIPPKSSPILLSNFLASLKIISKQRRPP